MRELAVQSSNDTNTEADRKEIQKEMNQLTSEVSRIGNNTEFNTQKLLDGTKTTDLATAGPAGDGLDASGVTAASVNLQIGANNGQQFEIEIGDMRSEALLVSGITGGFDASTITGVTGAAYVATDGGVNDLADDNSGATEFALDVTSADKATSAVEVLDKAIATVSSERSKLGAYQNRLEHTIANLGTASENLTSAESRIRDVDLAKEMMNFSKNNILSQAAQAMLAQANQQPQGVLQLLR
jgi:flagellin